MRREYHKSHSEDLGRDMELLIFGHAGMPLLVFPTEQGRFHDYEDFGMIGALRHRLDRGELQAFCVDSVDAESWYNKAAPPRQRVERHMQYERYILNEVLPLICLKNPSEQLAVTGCGFGGYHAINFALRHPEQVTRAVSMGGAFDVHPFLDGYFDEDCYYHCPPDFLPNLNDPWYIERYRTRTQLVLATGEYDHCLGENLRVSDLMRHKGIPHWLDVWGDGTGHDWPWWRQMAIKFFG